MVPGDMRFTGRGFRDVTGTGPFGPDVLQHVLIPVALEHDFILRRDLLRRRALCFEEHGSTSALQFEYRRVVFDGRDCVAAGRYRRVADRERERRGEIELVLDLRAGVVHARKKHEAGGENGEAERRRHDVLYAPTTASRVLT